VQLHRAREKFDQAGVELVLIGQATPRHAAHFRRRQGIELPVLADKERESYKAAGAKVATVGELLGPASATKGITTALRSGGRIRQGRTIGHNAQLGGSIVIKPDGTVAWSHMSEHAGDNASAEELLKAAKAAAKSTD
jgi:prostamide/prostaglandin F2alpha synthase